MSASTVNDSKTERHDVPLPGCSSSPLAGYLEALAVLRLVTEQVDRSAKGYFRGRTFHLVSRLDADALTDFFLYQYTPTPILSPWNKVGGFVGNRGKNHPISAILGSSTTRLVPYKEAIKKIDDLKSLPKNDKELKDVKNEFLARLRSRLPAAASAWLEACVVPSPERPYYNPLLGAGGGDGRLDYSITFMKYLIKLIPLKDEPEPASSKVKGRRSSNSLPIEDNRSLLKAALFDTITTELDNDVNMGQFLPGHAGGFNQGPGIEKKKFPANPWDFVLSLEGSLMFTSSISKKGAHGAAGKATIPFTVNASMAGHSSLSSGESNRGELWLPVWGRPVSLRELRSLLREGRSQIGRNPATNGVEFARAVATLGVDRGIDAFERYAYMERRGTSYVALHVGRLEVVHRPGVRLLDQLDPILRKVDRYVRGFGDNAPASLVRARRLMEQAMFRCAQDPSTDSFMEVLLAAGRIERHMCLAARKRSKEKSPKEANPVPKPLSGLSPQWLRLADDGSVEFRVAAGISSLHGSPSRKTGPGPFRHNLEAVDPDKPWQWSEHPPGHTGWKGSNLAERLASTAARRVMEVNRQGIDASPFDGSLRIPAMDAAAFVLGLTDDGLIEDLLWGLTWIDWRKSEAPAWPRPVAHVPVPRQWAMLHLLYAPRAADMPKIRLEPRIPGLLLGGHVDRAVHLARVRLMVDGLVPAEFGPFRNTVDPLRILAGLCIPVRYDSGIHELVLAEGEEAERTADHAA